MASQSELPSETQRAWAYESELIRRHQTGLPLSKSDARNARAALKRRAQGAAPDLLAALKSVRDQTNAVQHSQETRLNDIYDIANAAIEKVEGR